VNEKRDFPFTIYLGILYHSLVSLASIVGKKARFFMYERKESVQVFFKFYDDYADNYLEFMTGDQVKELMLALVDYHRDGIIPQFNDPLLAMAFKVISGNIDRDREKYLEMCEQNRQNALRRRQKMEEFGIV
jgi:hypothetical protein